MSLTELTAISPIDGRYRSKTKALGDYFSECALMRYRVFVEVEYFVALCEIPLPGLKKFDTEHFNTLRTLYRHFNTDDAKKIKDIEAVTNHDVKAVEYFLKEKFEEWGWKKFSEYIHFGLTSQDINNTAIPLSLKEFIQKIYLPHFSHLLEKLKKLSSEWDHVPMLARTHGQPASPTRLGKEIFVFVERLLAQKSQLTEIPFSAKFGGATGNHNAHVVAFPKINWADFSNHFINETLGLERSQFTTQIEHYDNLSAQFDACKRINNILLDLSRDMWQYISIDYFRQRINKKEIGSSAMPHKVNPIDFENAEGNLGVANALFEHFSAKLPISRLQRDLTDSTVLRNIGVPFGHTLIAFQSLQKGLDKLILNEEALHGDLDSNWAIVAEAVQTILRREGYPKPFEKLKELTRHHEKITQKNLHHFIDNLEVSDKVKAELKKITPFNYIGI
jgi:adenylosuccinate lyase